MDESGFSLTMKPVFIERNEAAMVQSLDPCDPGIWSGFLAEVYTGVQ